MGGVVGGDHVDGPVPEPLQQGLSILLASDGRVHLEAALLLQHAVVQKQVVGRGLAAHVQPLRLGPADQSYAFLGGYVAHMIAAARFPHQIQISGDLPPLGFGANAPVPMGGGVSTVVDIAAF